MAGILSRHKTSLSTFTVIEEEKKNKPFEGVKIYDKTRLNHVETEVKNPLPSSQGGSFQLSIVFCFDCTLCRVIYWNMTEKAASWFTSYEVTK